MNYGHLELRIEELLQEKGISKNMICKELDIPRSNFNRYCRNEFQRLDANLICKLCNYFECEIGELIRYVQEKSDKLVLGNKKYYQKFLIEYFIKWNYTVYNMKQTNRDLLSW